MVTESPLEMKQAFYIPLKVLFVFKMIKFLPGLFGHAERRLDRKSKIDFKNDDVTTWETNICNKNIVQYLQK